MNQLINNQSMNKSLNKWNEWIDTNKNEWMNDYFMLLAFLSESNLCHITTSSSQANNYAKLKSNFFVADACLWESGLKVFEIAKKQLSDGL